MGGFELPIILLLILLNGLLAMSELAVVSARPSRLQQRAEAGQRGAQAAIDLAANPSRFLSTVQIGITLIGIVTGVFGGATLAGPVSDLLSRLPFVDRHSGTIGLVLVVVAITYLTLIIGELVPKRLALQRSETFACLVAPPMAVLSRVASPLVSFLAWSGDGVLRLIGASQSDEPEVTAEEIELLLKRGADMGVFHRAEHSMVAGVFDIGARSAGELMTPRHRIDFLDLQRPEETNRQMMAEHPHSFYPVADGSADNVVGLVSTRELWRRQLSGESTDLRDAMEPALFVPEISPIFTVIEQMRRHQFPLAMVVDEYGGVEGLITFNDVLSDIVGEFDDPHRTNVKGGVLRDDGSWLLDGVFPVHEVRDLLEIETMPGEEEGHFETVGGFVMDQLGRIPEEGDYVTWSGYRFEVMDMDGIRIDKVLASPVPGETELVAGSRRIGG